MFEKNIKLFAESGDSILLELVEEIRNAQSNDDGTYGLGDYLWENIIYPAYIKAKERYAYVSQTRNAVNFASRLSVKRLQVHKAGN